MGNIRGVDVSEGSCSGLPGNLQPSIVQSDEGQLGLL